jgi:hypothetical protein
MIGGQNGGRSPDLAGEAPQSLLSFTLMSERWRSIATLGRGELRRAGLK